MAAALVISDAGAAPFSFDPAQAVATGSYPDAVRIGDVTGDGLHDVVLTTTRYFDPDNDYHVFVFAQQPGGGLADPVKFPYQASASRTGLALADLDGDGWTDIAVGHGSGISILHNDRAGGFDASVIGAPRGADTLDAVDVDLDGSPDLIGLSWSSGATIFINDGVGGIAEQRFLGSAARGYNDQKAADINGDGVTDLAIMSGQIYAVPNLEIHLHDTATGFLPPESYRVAASENTAGLGLGDFNDDGLIDVVLSRARNTPTHLWLYLQDASGALTGPTTVASHDMPETLQTADLDGDGLTDVAVLHGGWNRLGFYLQAAGTGLGAEQLVSIPYASRYGPHGLALGDINGDGCTDAAIADHNNGLVTLAGRGCAGADLATGLRVAGSTVIASADYLDGTPDRVDTTLSVAFTGTTRAPGVKSRDARCVRYPAGTAVRFECTVAALGRGGSREFEFRVRARRGDRVTIESSIAPAATAPDPQPANNTAVALF